MPNRSCAVCHVEGRLLDATSKDAVVDYFRCDRCGRIWTHQKGDPTSPAQGVTVKAPVAKPA